MQSIQVPTYQEFKSAGQAASEEVVNLSPTSSSSSDSLFDGDVDCSDNTSETTTFTPASSQEPTKPISARKQPAGKTPANNKPAGKSLFLLQQTTGFQISEDDAGDASGAESDPEPRKKYGGKGPSYMNRFARVHETYDSLMEDASEASDAETESSPAPSQTTPQIHSQLTADDMDWIDERLDQINYYIAIRERGLVRAFRPATPEDASYEADDDDEEEHDEQDGDGSDTEDNASEQPLRPTIGGKCLPDYARIDYVPASTSTPKVAASRIGQQTQAKRAFSKTSDDVDGSDTEEITSEQPLHPRIGGKGLPDYARIDYMPPSTSTPNVAVSRTGPRTTAKRAFSETSVDEDESTPPSASPKKQKRGTSTRPSSNDDLSPLVAVNETLVRSMDHSAKLPDANVRLSCPYPAPYDILAASQMRYQSLVAETQAKAGSGSRDRVAFTIFEDDQIIRHMLDVRLDASIPETERRFEVISTRLAADPNTLIPRSKMALKNMWCRIGRARSGFDERKAGNQDLEKVANKNPKYGKK